MVEAWEQQPGEPALWFARFTEFYLSAGPDRSLAAAYRTYRARQAIGTKPARDFSRAQPPGEWTRHCTAWRWVERAQAWDARQAILARRAYANAVKKANERHLAIVANQLSKLIRRTAELDFSAIEDMGELLKHTVTLINLERMLYGVPLQVEEVRRAPTDPLVTQAIKQSAAESCATPEMLASVCRILSDVGALGSIEEREPA
jgi:hypothetical protein